MRVVPRIALAYFSVVPLQSGITGIGVTLMLMSVVIGAMSQGAVGLALLGAGLTAMVPAMLGGVMLRVTSSRTILHLRPHGRLQMLLGATLAITLLAAVATLPVLVYREIHALRGAGGTLYRDISPLNMFAVGWSVAALVWLYMFIASGSRLLAPLIGFMPLALGRFGKALAPLLPHPLVALAASLAIWAAFGLWYLRVRAIRQLSWQGERPVGNLEGTPAGFIQARIDAGRGEISRGVATNQYLLGASSFVGYAVLGVAFVLLTALAVVVLRSFVFGNADAGMAPLVAQLMFLPPYMMTCASMGFWLTRRARLLWLRAGLDRAALFAHAERRGLLAGLLALGIAMVALLAFSVAHWPDLASAILVFGAAQIVFALCLFYGGLSLTRGWAAPDVLLCLGLCNLFWIEVLVFRPWNDARSAVAPTVFGALLLLVPLLRWRARRRWRSLDWRVAQLPRLGRPAPH